MASHAGTWKDPRIAGAFKQAESITGPAGRRLIELAGLPEDTQEALIVLDNACGTGIITALLHDMLSADQQAKLQLTCTDFAPSMVQSIQERLDANGWKGKTEVQDGMKMTLPDASFTHVLTNFGIMLMSDGTAALKESFRVLKSGGVIGTTTWAEMGWLPDVRAAFTSAPDPLPFPSDDGFRVAMGDGRHWHLPSFVEEELSTVGFVDVKTELVPSSSTVENLPMWVGGFALVIGSFVRKAWTQEQWERYEPKILPALLQYYKAKYGEEKPFEVKMVAIAAAARKP